MENMKFINIKIWWEALRPFSYTVSIFPPIIGTIFAAYSITFARVSWGNFFICLIGCISSHAGANLLSDYFDYINNVDRHGTLGSNRCLIEKLLNPRQVLLAAMLAYLIALLIGSYFVLTLSGGYRLIWLIAFGGFLGICYTGGPFQLKYHALGDIAVFLGFGSAMSLGAYFVQTSSYTWQAAIYIVPLALLVNAILHSNNIRDREHDVVVNIKTLVILVGEKISQKLYLIFVLLSYVLVALFVCFLQLPAATLLVLFSLPLAISNIRKVEMKNSLIPQQFASIDADTGKLHCSFGLLMTIGLIVDYFYR